MLDTYAAALFDFGCTLFGERIVLHFVKQLQQIFVQLDIRFRKGTDVRRNDDLFFVAVDFRGKFAFNRFSGWFGRLFRNALLHLHCLHRLRLRFRLCRRRGGRFLGGVFTAVVGDCAVLFQKYDDEDNDDRRQHDCQQYIHAREVDICCILRRRFYRCDLRLEGGYSRRHFGNGRRRIDRRERVIVVSEDKLSIFFAERPRQLRVDISLRRFRRECECDRCATVRFIGCAENVIEIFVDPGFDIGERAVLSRFDRSRCGNFNGNFADRTLHVFERRHDFPDLGCEIAPFSCAERTDGRYDLIDFRFRRSDVRPNARNRFGSGQRPRESFDLLEHTVEFAPDLRHNTRRFVGQALHRRENLLYSAVCRCNFARQFRQGL